MNDTVKSAAAWIAAIVIFLASLVLAFLFAHWFHVAVN